MAQDEYKIVIKKDDKELKILEKDLDVQRKKELDAVKTSNKVIIEQEKRKTKELEQQHKVALENVKANQKLELEQYKNTQKEKIRIAKEQAKQEADIKRKAAQEESKKQKQGYGYAPGSFKDLERQSQIVKSQLKSGLSLKGEVLGTAEVQRLKTELAGINPVIKSATREMNTMGVQGKRSIYQLLEAAENVTTVLFGVGYAVSQIYTKGKDIITTAADVETLGVVVHTLGKNAGYTESQIDNYVKSVKAMGITTKSSQQVIAKMIQSELDLNDAVGLADVSRNAAVIGLTNTSDAYETIINAITTMNPESLKQLGLGMNLTQVYKDYAKQMKIVNRDLLDSEKRTAITNEVMRKGVGINNAYSDAMETAGKKMKSFERYTEEAKVSLGTSFLPVVNTSIDAVTWLTQRFTESEKPIQVFAGGIFLIGSNITTLLPAIASLKYAFGTGFLTVLGWAGVAIGVLATEAMMLYDAISALLRAIKLIPDVIKRPRMLIEPMPQEKEGGESLNLNYIEKWNLKGKLGADLINKGKEELKQEKEKGRLLDEEIRKKNELLNKKGGKGGKSQDVEDKKEELDLLVLAKEELGKIQDKMNANLLNLGAMIDLRREEKDLLEKISYIETGRSKELATQMTMFLGSRIGAKEGYRLGATEKRGEPSKQEEAVSTWDEIYNTFGDIENVSSSIGNIFSKMMNSLGLGADSFVGKLVSGFQTVTNIVQTLIAIMQTVSLVSSLIPFLQHGTESFAGGLAVVGERGAELVNLPKGTEVIPNNRISSYVNNYNSNVVTSQSDVFIEANLRELEFFRRVKKQYSKFQSARRVS